MVILNFCDQVLVGNRMWMVRNGIDVTGDIEEQVVYHEERGQTVVLAAINSELSIPMHKRENWVISFVLKLYVDEFNLRLKLIHFFRLAHM